MFSMFLHHKSSLYYPQQVSKIKPVTDLYDWGGIKYPTVISNNDYAIFEKEILEISLVVLYASVGIKVFIEKGEVKLHTYKSINNQTCLNIIIQDKKSSFIINSWQRIN